MKIKCFLISWIVIIAAALLLSGCKKEREYRDALPNGAQAVISVNLMDMLAKAGTESLKDPKLKQNVLQGLSPQTKELVSRIFDNPNASGIAFVDPIYFFAEENNSIGGVLMKVDKLSDLEKLMDALKTEGVISEIKSQDHYQAAYFPNNKAICVYDECRLLCLTVNGAVFPESLLANADVLLKQTGKQPLQDAIGFNKFLIQKSDIGFWFTSDVLSGLNPYMVSIPKTLQQYKYNSVGGILFETGKITGEMTSLPIDELSQKQLDEFRFVYGRMDGVFFNRVPKESVLNWGVHINNLLPVYNIITQQPQFDSLMQQAKSSAQDFEKMLKSIKGDVFLDISSLEAAGLPKMSLMAQVTDTSIADYLMGYLKGMGLPVIKVKGNIYTVAGIVSIYTTAQELVITTDQKVIDAMSNGMSPSFAASPLAKTYMDNNSLFFVDVNKIMSSPMIAMFRQNNQNFTMAQIALRQISSIQTVSPSVETVKFEANMVNTKDNSLKVIIDTAKTLAGQ